MARFVQNDAIIEGRQYDGTNITKLARWLGDDWAFEILGVDQQVMVPTELGPEVLNPSDWILLDPGTRVILAKTNAEVENELKIITIHPTREDAGKIDKTKSIEKRFGFVTPDSEEDISSHAMVRQAMKTAATILEHQLPDGRYKSLCMTSLEEAAMWGNKAVSDKASN